MALPNQIDPRKLALQGNLLEGTVNVADLTRLESSVSAICGPLEASIQFGLDESRAKIAEGQARVPVETVCQRCLDPVRLDLQAKFAVQVIWSEDHLNRVAANYEPWLVVDKLANLNELLEDEILLALPLVNYHPVGECTGDTFMEEVEATGDEVALDNPFNVLLQLKK
ncbi:MAG: YceD family protein [Porticoccaceae bacterium]